MDKTHIEQHTSIFLSNIVPFFNDVIGGSNFTHKCDFWYWSCPSILEEGVVFLWWAKGSHGRFFL